MGLIKNLSLLLAALAVALQTGRCAADSVGLTKVVYAGFDHLLTLRMSKRLTASAYDYHREYKRASTCDPMTVPPVVSNATVADMLTREGMKLNDLVFTYMGYELFMTQDRVSGAYVMRRCRNFGQPSLPPFPCMPTLAGKSKKMIYPWKTAMIGHNRVALVNEHTGDFNVYFFDADVRNGGDPFHFEFDPLYRGNLGVPAKNVEMAYVELRNKGGDLLIVHPANSSVVKAYRYTFVKSDRSVLLEKVAEKPIEPGYKVSSLGENQVLLHKANLEYNVWTFLLNTTYSRVGATGHPTRKQTVLVREGPTGVIGAGRKCMFARSDDCLAMRGCGWCPTEEKCAPIDLRSRSFCNPNTCKGGEMVPAIPTPEFVADEDNETDAVVATIPGLEMMPEPGFCRADTCKKCDHAWKVDFFCTASLVDCQSLCTGSCVGIAFAAEPLVNSTFHADYNGTRNGTSLYNSAAEDCLAHEKGACIIYDDAEHGKQITPTGSQTGMFREYQCYKPTNIVHDPPAVKTFVQDDDPVQPQPTEIRKKETILIEDYRVDTAGNVHENFLVEPVPANLSDVYAVGGDVVVIEPENVEDIVMETKRIGEGNVFVPPPPCNTSVHYQNSHNRHAPSPEVFDVEMGENIMNTFVDPNIPKVAHSIAEKPSLLGSPSGHSHVSHQSAYAASLPEEPEPCEDSAQKEIMAESEKSKATAEDPPIAEDDAELLGKARPPSAMLRKMRFASRMVQAIPSDEDEDGSGFQSARSVQADAMAGAGYLPPRQVLPTDPREYANLFDSREQKHLQGFIPVPRPRVVTPPPVDTVPGFLDTSYKLGAPLARDMSKFPLSPPVPDVYAATPTPEPSPTPFIPIQSEFDMGNLIDPEIHVQDRTDAYDVGFDNA